MEAFETDSPEATELLGKSLAERLEVGDCVAIVGQLGAGKTVLVRGIAMGLGLGDAKLVSSPTYVLVQEYPAKMTVYHLDLYRINDSREITELGLSEMLDDGVVLIEWADRAGKYLPRSRWRIDIEMTGLENRRFELQRIND